jgi:hypothetical protein
MRRRGVGVAAGAVAGITLVVAAIAVTSTDSLRWTLAVTCLAAGALVAIATWLVSVEPDDEGDADEVVEPKWWPDFERELAEWQQSRRVPAGR